MKYCPKCGAVIEEDSYEGIRGWLLLLCIGLTVFLPLLALNNIDINLQLLSKFGNEKTYIVTYKLAKFENYKITIIAAIGFIAGALMWLRQSIGVILAKIFFILLILSNLMSLVFAYVLEMPENLRAIVLSEGIILESLLIVISILGLAYLQKSLRVMDTYSTKTVF